MRRIAIPLCAALSVACAENGGALFEPDVNRTITIEGNGDVSCTIDLVNCFGILDAEVKALYELNNTAARRGEAEYRIVTNSNNELATIYLTQTMSVADAVGYMDRFIRQVESAVAHNNYGECWGDYLLQYANWLRGKIAASSLNVSDRPTQSCFISPVTGTAAASSAGVTLTLADPWHFSGDPYGIYITTSYFVIVGPNGTITTTPAVQSGAATVVVTDPSTTAPGTYTYSVMQCSEHGCSVATNITVTISQTGGGGGACVHDNRNGGFTPPPTQPKCEKDEKIHKNT